MVRTITVGDTYWCPRILWIMLSPTEDVGSLAFKVHWLTSARLHPYGGGGALLYSVVFKAEAYVQARDSRFVPSQV